MAVAALVPLLDALARAESIFILELLAQGVTDPEEISRSLGLPENEIKSQLETLARAGIAAEQGGAEVPQLAYHAMRLLSAALGRPSVTGHAQNGGGQGDALPMPSRTPLACTVCDNSGFVSDVLAELRGALGEARGYHSRIQEMSSQVLTAHEAERKRIARELHDDTAQALTSMLVRLRLLELSSTDAEVLKNAEELRELTAGALDSVRRMATDLRPAALDDLGLAPALKAYAERFSRRWDIEVLVQLRGVTRRLPREVELVLYRVFQEALTNIAKHAGASRVHVTLVRQRNQVVLSVDDNGRGFIGRGDERPEDTGLGLFGMRERLALVSGTLEVKTTAGAGTTITARVALSPQTKTGRSS